MKQKEPFQYAKLPTYQYQTFERQYQKFDRNTLRFAYYPVFHSNSAHLTPGTEQENDGAAEPEKSPAADDAPVEESSASPTEDSSPESPGKR
jgi:hypothetical protein